MEARMKVVEFPQSGGDVPDELKAKAELQHSFGEPKLFADGLPPNLDPALLPDALRRFLSDIALRAQCPLDYPAVAALVAISGVIGGKRTIAPNLGNDWIVVPNLWGMVIGPPGTLKSPSMSAALAPLYALCKRSRDEYEEEHAAWESRKVERDIRAETSKQNMKDALKRRDSEMAESYRRELQDDDPEPTERRFVTNDATIEKLGALMKENPNGIILYRDELIGLLKTCDRAGHEGDRAFYLESWSGDSSFTFDRITRGTVYIENCRLSIIGGTQPEVIKQYITAARDDSAGADGLVQRFQLMVCPSMPAWVPGQQHHPVNQTARDAAFRLFEDLSSLHHQEHPLSFDRTGQRAFDEWRDALEIRIRSRRDGPWFESHIAKYRSLVPSLALIYEVIGDPSAECVSLRSVQSAIAFTRYLERHAAHIYQIGTSDSLAKKIGQWLLDGRFESITERQAYRKFRGSDRDEVMAALETLVEMDWIAARTRLAKQKGGRPTEDFVVNPGVYVLDG